MALRRKAPSSNVNSAPFFRKINRIVTELDCARQECDKVLSLDYKAPLHNKFALMRSRLKDAHLLLKDALVKTGKSYDDEAV